jgi:hypothetical protein
MLWRNGFTSGKVHLSASSKLLKLASADLDLILSNPPYLPAAREEAGSEIAGKAVIQDILVKSGPKALRPDGVILMVHSTLSETVIGDCITTASKRGCEWIREELCVRRWVPLDLPEVQGDSSWLSDLVRSGADHVLIDTASRHHEVRHGVVVSAFSRIAG